MTVLVASDALVAGEVRVVRLESALGPCVQGLHEKREKVPHPGLQHVSVIFSPCNHLTRSQLERMEIHLCSAPWTLSPPVKASLNLRSLLKLRGDRALALLLIRKNTLESWFDRRSGTARRPWCCPPSR